MKQVKFSGTSSQQYIITLFSEVRREFLWNICLNFSIASLPVINSQSLTDIENNRFISIPLQFSRPILFNKHYKNCKVSTLKDKREELYFIHKVFTVNLIVIGS